MSASNNAGGDLDLKSTVSRVPTASKPPQFGLLQEIAFVTTVISAQLLTQACLAISIAPLHVIGDSFGENDPGTLSWLPAGYSLTVGTFILPAGRWGDLYGHKNLFILGWAWFALWSLIAGFSVYSHSLPFFAFCRAMQGIGPAILLPNAIAILARTYPEGKKKNMIFSLFGATAPGGFILGAVFSGIFTELVWWPWSYWVLGMVLALMVVISWFIVPPMPVAGGKPRLQEFDVVGTTLGVCGLVLFNFAWNQGAGASWQKVYVYVLLIVGVILLVAFIWFERKRAALPLLPMEAFTRDTSLVFGCIACGWASFGIWAFYFWWVTSRIVYTPPLRSTNLRQAISGSPRGQLHLTYGSQKLSGRNFRCNRSYRHWYHYQQDATWRHHVHLHVCILHRHNPAGNQPCRPIILGTILREHPGRYLGHGK